MDWKEGQRMKKEELAHERTRAFCIMNRTWYYSLRRLNLNAMEPIGLIESIG